MPRWPFLLVIILLIALTTLAALQVNWIGEVARAREQRLRAEMDEAMRRVAEDATREVFGAAAMFETRGLDASELSARYDRWRAVARDPHLIREIDVLKEGRAFRLDPATRSFVPIARIPSPADLALRMQENLTIVFDEPALVPQIAASARRNLGPDFDVAIALGGAILYRSDPQWPTSFSGARPDIARDVLPKVRRERRMPTGREPNAFTVLARHHGEPLPEVFAAKRRAICSQHSAFCFCSPRARSRLRGQRGAQSACGGSSSNSSPA